MIYKKISRYFLALVVLFILLFGLKFVPRAETSSALTSDQAAGFISQEESTSCLATSSNYSNRQNISNYQVLPINVTGTCVSAAGCDIYVCNTANNYRAEGINRAQNTNCRNRILRGVTRRVRGRDTGELLTFESCEEEIQNTVTTLQETEIEVTPGCQRLDNFTNNLSSSGRGAGGYQLPPGQIDITVNQNALRHVGYSYYAKGPTRSEVVTVDMGRGAEVSGEAGTQQVGQLSEFEFLTPSSSDDPANQTCVPISWDPYGRVFDAVSLEPMADIMVSLLEKENGVFFPAVQLNPLNNNYSYTDERGIYNIMVDKPGTYYLDADPPSTHEFIDNPKLSPNYSRIYRDIYYPSQSFEENINQITHHDIPLQPKGAPYRGAAAKPIAESFESLMVGNSMIYRGRVTFPYAKVCLKGSLSGSLIVCGQADSRGVFNIKVSRTKIFQDEPISVDVSKVDLNALSEDVQKEQSIVVGNDYVAVPENSEYIFEYEPILNYIEGYTYDSEGTIVSQSKVTVRLKMNNQVVYTTRSDSKGFFAISARNLPINEYYLEFTDRNNRTMIITTSEFVSLNSDYITKENLDLVAGTKNSRPMTNKSIKRIDDNSNRPEVDEELFNPKKKGINKLPWFNNVAVVLLLIVFVATAVGLILYIKKQKSLHF